MSAITDDAMVVEQETGVKVALVEGSYKNIKITTPEDLDIAEIFLKALKKWQVFESRRIFYSVLQIEIKNY